MLKRWVILGVIVFFYALPSLAQVEQELFTQYFKEDLKHSGFRNFLNNFTIRGLTGYGQHLYRENLSDYYLIQGPNDFSGISPISENAPMIGQEAYPFVNWFNSPVRDSLLLTDNYTITSPDGIKIGFKGMGWAVPIHLTLQYRYKKFRFGAGYGIEYTKVNSLKPLVGDQGIADYQTGMNGSFNQRYFGSVAYRIKEYRDYTWFGELEIGKTKYGSQFNVRNGIYVSLSSPIERELSEYFKVIIRPSIDFQSFKTTADTEINTTNWGFYLGVGVSYSLPKLKRCPVHTCNVQINHQHAGYEFRSRRHPFFKWQNPNYGQNNPTLIKYKGKNKKEINPF